jgi:hypothetical protein
MLKNEIENNYYKNEINLINIKKNELKEFKKTYLFTLLPNFEIEKINLLIFKSNKIINKFKFNNFKINLSKIEKLEFENFKNKLLNYNKENILWEIYDNEEEENLLNYNFNKLNL